MGVPRLFPWLRKHFRSTIQIVQPGEGTPLSVDYLYLDANGMLHEAAQQVFNYGPNKNLLSDYYKDWTPNEKENEVYKIFFEKICRVVDMMNPGVLLYIAIDGPAPLAKQSQQRERRYVSARERGKGSPLSFDSNSITPGTLFMHGLTQYINYAIRVQCNFSEKWRTINVIFSPPTVGGEGEHKLMDYIRALPYDERMNRSHCLFGPDGDLIMLTLAAHVPNMYLFKENQFDKGHFYHIDMGEVRDRLPRELGSARDLDDTTDDFIIQGFFVGNDSPAKDSNVSPSRRWFGLDDFNIQENIERVELSHIRFSHPTSRFETVRQGTFKT